MESLIRELFELLIRWTHLIAGIMWIGNSLLFNALDRTLEPPAEPREGVFGKTWLLHSGAFYEVEKKLLPPGQLPERLTWYMWQNLTTWVSGMFLLVLVYYLGGAAYTIDPTVATLTQAQAILIGLGFLVGGWVVYDLLWRAPFKKNMALGITISLALLLIAAYLLTQLFSGRAAYIHVGAMLGTLMTANVWFYVIPSQYKLVAATKAGLPQDIRLALRAKERSIHNNYMTFPVLFIMISSHYPSTYGSSFNWLVLAVLMVGSALVRHFLNTRFTYRDWLRWAFASGIAAILLVFLIIGFLDKRIQFTSARGEDAVAFSTVRGIIETRCEQCHSVFPTDDTFKVAPLGVLLNTPEQIQTLAPKILDRVVINKNMPFNNKTQMTEEERAILGQWIAEGARIE